jgi:hypothetical protein
MSDDLWRFMQGRQACRGSGIPVLVRHLVAQAWKRVLKGEGVIFKFSM